MSEQDQDPTTPPHAAQQPVPPAQVGQPPAQVSQPPAQAGQPPQPAQPAPGGDARQWIPVPPPNPYAAAGAPRGGRVFAILAMTLGLVSLLSIVVGWFFYRPVYVGMAILFAIAAIVLGIVALVKRHRPKAAGIVGIVSGGLSIVGSAVLLVLISVALIAATANLSGDASGSGNGSGGTDQWQPGSPQQQLLEWPANMASGGIIFEQGGGAPAVRASDPVPSGKAPVAPSIDRANGVADIIVYLDYRCPFCRQFEEANGSYLEGLVNSGKATVQIVPLTFLDGRFDQTQYSARASGAMACIASGQPEVAWRAHQALLSTEHQPGEDVAAPDTDTLIATLNAATGGLDAGVRDCIGTGRFQPFATALNDWVFTNPVPNAQDDTYRVHATPTVMVNGQPYQGDPSDPAAFSQFFDEQTR